MTPDRWRRVKEIFQRAMECGIAERHALVADSTADDPELRREVEKMLRHAGDTGLLDRPAWEGLAERELEPGSRLGPYEIVAKIGAGGMGSVYQARDTRLGRTVAIKVLSAEFTNRLRLEGRAISALNHPHVCALYDIGDQEGYLVMEYVEGESLAARLTRGPLPIEAVLRYGAEIADALAAAHGQGIVHRDLKPANIMITPAGAKVLDFGVARISQDADTGGAGLVGTAAYMSPSQLNGNPADARSDIFALGLVLYEMATGSRYSRESHPDLAGVPAGLARLIEQCLRPNAADRVQTMEELRSDLERLGAEPARGIRSRWRAAAGVAALAAVAAVTAALTSRMAPPQAAPLAVHEPYRPLPAEAQPARPPTPSTTAPEVRRASYAPPSLATVASYPGMERDPSFSPDGGRMAFSWNQRGRPGYGIFVKPVKEQGPPEELTDGWTDDWGPAWSPDGRRIAFERRSSQWGIYCVGASGGTPILVAPLARQDRETLPQIAWSRDGKWIAAPDRDSPATTRIYLFAVDAGERRLLTFHTGGTDHAPAFSPDGKSLAYAHCEHGVYACDVYVIGLDRGLAPKRERRVTDQGIYLRGISWLADGRGLVYSAGRTQGENTSLWRVSVNPPGEPQRIDLAGSHARHPAVSQSGGLLAYTRLDGWALMLIRNFR